MTARTLFATLLALLLILLLAIWCVPRKAQQIETDIQQSTNAALQAAGLTGVQASADGQWVTLTGDVPGLAEQQQAGEIAAGIAGVTQVDNQVQVSTASRPPPAFELGIDYDGHSIVLHGSTPDDATRRSIIEHARLRFGETNVQANIEVVGGPAGEVADIVNRRLLAGLSQLKHGSALISNNRLMLTGAAATEEQRLALMESLSESLPPPYLPVFSLSIARPPPVAAENCQRQFTQLLKNRTIHFATNRADIQPDSLPLLDQLAATAAICPGSRIEIAGHTDSAGSAEYNLRLSQRRAQAVVDYLIGKKIPKERLVAKGYGETRPIASNDTPEGRRKNRRIEFRVLQAKA